MDTADRVKSANENPVTSVATIEEISHMSGRLQTIPASAAIPARQRATVSR